MELLKNPIHIEHQWRTSWSDGLNWNFVADFASLEQAQIGIQRMKDARILRNRTCRIVDTRTDQVLWLGSIIPTSHPWDLAHVVAA